MAVDSPVSDQKARIIDDYIRGATVLIEDAKLRLLRLDMFGARAQLDTANRLLQEAVRLQKNSENKG